MRRILVIAHKTLAGEHLVEEVSRRMRSGACQVHLLVPVHHPMGAWTEASVTAAATEVLEDGLRRFREADRTGSCDVTGEVGDANPVYAAQSVRNRGETFDEIIVSTLPKGPSQWLRGGIPGRLAKEFPDIPVVHVSADQEPALR